MAYSFVVYPGLTGEITDFSVPFGYISRSDVTADVDGVPAPFTWLTDSMIRMETAPVGDLTIRRDTEKRNRVVTFVDGSTQSAAQHNLQDDQVLFITQEAFDASENRLPGNGIEWDGLGRPLKNLGDPEDPTDAVTRQWAETSMSSQLAQASALKEAAEVAASKVLHAVSVYSDRSEVESTQIPPVVAYLRTAGYTEPGDGGAALYKRAVSEPPHGGKVQSADGAWWEIAERAPNLSQFGRDFTPQSLIEHLQARMAAGEAVKIACYGDSTTDGNYTTGWTRNPTDSDGEAIGNVNHNPDAPNSWPVKLEWLLREMHRNSSIEVWNAGYSGKRLDNGWAYRNYERAIIDNPHYGTPDAVILAFGLNDAAQAGSQLAVTVAETRKMCLKIMSHGSIPILMDSDPISRNDINAVRDSREISRQINAAKRALAAELSIPYIALEGEMKRWLGVNRDGYQWNAEQPDGLHFTDNGHAFKAGLVARTLFRDVIVGEPGLRRRIDAWDSSCNPVGSNTYGLSNNAQGGNWLTSGGTKGDRLLDLWVWNTAPDMELVYRGIQGEGAGYEGTGTLTDNPAIAVYDPITGNEVVKPLSAPGFTQNSFYRRSDIPYRFGFLPYGLSRVSYKAGAAGGGYYGYFELVPARRGPARDALTGIGPVSRTFTSGNVAVFFEEMTDGTNEVGGLGEDKVEVSIDASIPVGTGVILFHTAGWSGNTNITYGERVGLLLYRADSTTIQMRLINNIGGTVSFTSAIYSGTIPPGDDQKLRIEIGREGDAQTVKLYDAIDGGAAIINQTRTQSTYPIPMAGVVGGLYYSASAAGGPRTVAIRQLTTRTE